MKAPSPDTLKLSKDYQRPVIAFAIARPDDSDTAYLGCSDFKVYAADFAADKFEPKESCTLTRATSPASCGSRAPLSSVVGTMAN